MFLLLLNTISGAALATELQQEATVAMKLQAIGTQLTQPITIGGHVTTMRGGIFLVKRLSAAAGLLPTWPQEVKDVKAVQTLDAQIKALADQVHDITDSIERMIGGHKTLSAQVFAAAVQALKQKEQKETQPTQATSWTGNAGRPAAQSGGTIRRSASAHVPATPSSPSSGPHVGREAPRLIVVAPAAPTSVSAPVVPTVMSVKTKEEGDNLPTPPAVTTTPAKAKQATAEAEWKANDALLKSAEQKLRALNAQREDHVANVNKIKEVNDELESPVGSVKYRKLQFDEARKTSLEQQKKTLLSRQLSKEILAALDNDIAEATQTVTQLKHDTQELKKKGDVLVKEEKAALQSQDDTVKKQPPEERTGRPDVSIHKPTARASSAPSVPMHAKLQAIRRAVQGTDSDED